MYMVCAAKVVESTIVKIGHLLNDEEHNCTNIDTCVYMVYEPRYIRQAYISLYAALLNWRCQSRITCFTN